MVKQGDIIKMNFDPQRGHEQKGFRPALVVSNNTYNSITGMTMVCPITNNEKSFPTHLSLDDRTKTTGKILCEHIKAVDLVERGYDFVEKLPSDILSEVIDLIISEVEEEENARNL